MRPSPIQLASATLGFDRTGHRLIVVEPDAVAVVDLDRSQTLRLEHSGAHAAIGFDDQLWIATRDERLVRYDLEGHPIGDPVPLAFSSPPALLAAPCGPAAALWGALPATALHDDFGQLIRSELANADLILPLTGKRHVIVRGDKLVLPTGAIAKLPTAGVLGGAVLADGRSVVLVTGTSMQRTILVVSLGTGAIAQRCPMSGSSIVRLANRRAVAVVLADPRSLAVIDLRTGRELGTARFERDIRDLAVDADGKRLAVRDATSCIEMLELDELLRWSAEQKRADVAMEQATPTTERVTKPIRAESTSAVDQTLTFVTIEPDHEIVTSAPRLARGTQRDISFDVSDIAAEDPPLLALAPRTRPASVDRPSLLSQLDRELNRIALWTLHSIANAWDTRRIGYGNEGKHPYELEVAAILGLNRGHAQDYIAAARERIAELEAVIAADPGFRATDTPIGALIREHDLSARQVDILLVVAAGSLWGEIARLYGVLANDATRPAVDELVVQQVLAARHDRHDIAAELEPRAPLVYLGLVQVSARRARPFAELAVEPVVLDLLRARPPELGDATTVRTSDRTLASLDLAPGLLAHAVGQLSRSTPQPRILVRGRAGSGRTTLLAALAAAAERELAVIDAVALPRTMDKFVDALRSALRRAHVAGFIPCIVRLDDVNFDEHAARDIAADVLRAHPGPIAIITLPDAPVPFAAGHVALELAPLDETERRRVWVRACAETNLANVDIEILASRYRIGPAMIRRACAAAAARKGDATPLLDDYIRQTRDARLSQFAHRVDRLASWSSIVLAPDILDSLRELVGRVRHRRTVFDTWGMGRTMATSRGLTALFQGPPGTGKTLVAGVIARELGLELYQVDLSKVMSKWIGETERNLSQIFDAAEDGQVVLLFDEADSLFAKRTEVRSSNDRYANLEVNYLLQRLDSFEGIAILTTNLGTSIDQAFKRRMSFRLSFPFPDEETREQLWRAHLPAELPIDGELALDALARKYQLSGGYIRNACLRAAFLAAQQETALCQHHLERAVALEFAELGKLSTNGTID
jgi:AAA+ superfamily predicted ATPase